MLSLFHLRSLSVSSPPSAPPHPSGRGVWFVRPSSLRTAPPPSGFLLLGEVEDLAVGLPQVLLLFEVHLKRPLDGHKGDASLKRGRKKKKDSEIKDSARHVFHFHTDRHKYETSDSS